MPLFGSPLLGIVIPGIWLLRILSSGTTTVNCLPIANGKQMPETTTNTDKDVPSIALTTGDSSQLYKTSVSSSEKNAESTTITRNLKDILTATDETTEYPHPTNMQAKTILGEKSLDLSAKKKMNTPISKITNTTGNGDTKSKTTTTILDVSNTNRNSSTLSTMLTLGVNNTIAVNVTNLVTTTLMFRDEVIRNSSMVAETVSLATTANVSNLLTSYEDELVVDNKTNLISTADYVKRQSTPVLNTVTGKSGMKIYDTDTSSTTPIVNINISTEIVNQTSRLGTGLSKSDALTLRIRNTNAFENATKTTPKVENTSVLTKTRRRDTTKVPTTGNFKDFRLTRTDLPTTSVIKKQRNVSQERPSSATLTLESQIDSSTTIGNYKDSILAQNDLQTTAMLNKGIKVSHETIPSSASLSIKHQTTAGNFKDLRLAQTDWPTTCTTVVHTDREVSQETMPSAATLTAKSLIIQTPSTNTVHQNQDPAPPEPLHATAFAFGNPAIPWHVKHPRRRKPK